MLLGSKAATLLEALFAAGQSLDLRMENSLRLKRPFTIQALGFPGCWALQKDINFQIQEDTLSGILTKRTACTPS